MSSGGQRATQARIDARPAIVASPDERLIAEGYVQAAPPRGTYVHAVPPRRGMVTPSHQGPSGMTTTLERRLALLG